MILNLYFHIRSSRFDQCGFRFDPATYSDLIPATRSNSIPAIHSDMDPATYSDRIPATP